MPAISGFFLPADILRIFPQKFDLICRVSGVPQAISQEFSRSSFAVDQLDLNSGLGVSDERLLVPIFLRVSFPRDCIESFVALVTEDESDVIIIDLGINEKRSFKINVGKRIVSNRHSRIAVKRLHHLSTFVVNPPARIFLIVADRIESHFLEGSEISREDFVVVRTNIDEILNTVAIEIFFTSIADSVVVFVELIAILWKKNYENI